MKKHLSIFTASLMVLAVMALPCLAKQLSIVTSTSDLADAVRNIAGSRVSVQNICQGFQNPHQVETKPSYLRTLQKADGFIQTGLSLEIAWAPSLLRNSRNTKIMPGGLGFLEASSGIKILERPQGQVDRSMGDAHPDGNPHYTLNPNNMKYAARSITAFLKRIDPEGSAIYDKGYSNYWNQIDKADKRWVATLKPYAKAPIVTYHSTWPYFAQHFNLKVIGCIENQPGISPSAQHLNNLTAAMKKANVKVIVLEPWFADNIARTLASKTGAKVLRLPILPGGVPNTETYIKMMDYNVNQLAGALR